MKTSPCIGQCANVDVKRELCLGCFRTFDEIADWWDKSPEERRKVLKKLKYRRREGTRPDEDTVLKTAAGNAVGGSSPSPSAKELK